MEIKTVALVWDGENICLQRGFFLSSGYREEYVAYWFFCELGDGNNPRRFMMKQTLHSFMHSAASER
jgi:hypothetical protein